MPIRPARLTDFETVAALFLDIQRIHADALPQIYKDPDPAMVTWERYQTLLKDPRRIVWILETDEGVVGYLNAEVSGQGDSVYRQASSYLYVQQLAVRRDMQRRGYGSQLLQALQQFADEAEIPSITLDVWQFNQSAQAFYHAQGFEVLSQRLQWHRDPDSVT